MLNPRAWLPSCVGHQKVLGLEYKCVRTSVAARCFNLLLVWATAKSAMPNLTQMGNMNLKVPGRTVHASRALSASVAAARANGKLVGCHLDCLGTSWPRHLRTGCRAGCAACARLLWHGVLNKICSKQRQACKMEHAAAIMFAALLGCIVIVRT